MASFNVREYTLPGSHIRDFARATANAQDEVLQVAVKEYIPKDNSEPKEGDVTIIGAHANGFPKELYEALWDDLHEQSKKHGFRIRSIIITDAAWQGQSSLINAGKLGNDPGWLDMTRDILHVINTLRPPPPLFGVGHSFGGACLAALASMHPRLLAALILVDPVISRFSSSPGRLSRTAGAQSLYRRQRWPSRDAALAGFDRSPFYGAWDGRVLEAWKKWGIMRPSSPNDDGGGGGERKEEEEGEEVVLTTSTDQEMATYFRPSWDAYDKEGKELVRPDLVPDMDPTLHARGFVTWPVYRAEGAAVLGMLPTLRPPVLYLVGGQSGVSSADIRRARLETTGTGQGGSGGAAKGRVREVAFEDRGHLLPMEIPGPCAVAAAGWIAAEASRWTRENDEYKEWTKKSAKEKSSLDGDWYRYIPNPRKPQAGKSKI